MSRDNHHPGGERQPRPPRSSRARGREEHIPESEIGPLGMGQAPVKDPLKLQRDGHCQLPDHGGARPILRTADAVQAV